jgi:hypothetical protein
MEQECCPKFDPAPWDSEVFSWEQKKFIKGKVFALMYVPLNFSSVITKLMAKIDLAGAKPLDNLTLSDHTSPWNMNLYVAVDKDVPGAENVTMSGKFYSKVYEGDFKNTAKWGEDFKKIVQEKNMKIKKLYMWYTTCPKCAKKYGKNYVVTIAEVE